MNFRSGLAYLASILLLSSCNFSVGTKTNLGTGLSINYSGFSVDEAYLVDANNQVKSDNEVELGSQVAIVLEGITNYELKDGNAQPGMMLKVVDANGTAVIDEADLFAGGDGYSPEDAAILRGTVTVGDPMKADETYHVSMRIWDKNKPESEITAEVDIDVK